MCSAMGEWRRQVAATKACPQGQRVGKQQGDTLEDYVYDPQGHITSLHDGSTNLLRAELYAGDRHVATWNPNPNYGPLF
jgi:hypothetical protein